MAVDSEKLWARCSKAVVAAMRASDLDPVLRWAREECASWGRAETVNCLESVIASKSTWTTTTPRERMFLISVRAAVLKDLDAQVTSDRGTLIQGVLLGLRAVDEVLYEHSIAVGELATRIAVKDGWSPERALDVGDAGRLHELGRVQSDRSGDAASKTANRQALGLGLDALDMHEATRPLKSMIRGMYVSPVWSLTEEMALLRVAEGFVTLCSPARDRAGESPDRAIEIMRGEIETYYSERFVDLLDDVLRMPG